MNKIISRIILMIPLIVLASCGGVDVGEVQSDKTSIHIQEEKAMDVTIRLGAGDLTVRGDTTRAQEIEFTYNVDKLKPIIDYQVSEQTGQLSVTQGNLNVPLGNIDGLEYKGDIVLNQTIPTKLYIKTGAGTNDLDLKNIQLNQAEIITGVGQTTIHLDGDYQSDFETKIESGVGMTEIIVPKDVGVRIFVDSGVGQVETEGLMAESKELFFNQAYENSKVKIDLKIKMGVGDLKIVEGE